MLYSLSREEYINGIPYRADYDRWRRRLSNAEYQAIYDELHARISGSEIETSSWIPGANWEGTVYQPIYETACEYDEGAAARFFGLILWHVFLEHEAVWAFGRYEKEGIPIEGLTYFQLKNPPPR